MCPVCLGKGKVFVRLSVRSCKRCNATGRAISTDPSLAVKFGRKLCSLCQRLAGCSPKLRVNAVVTLAGFLAPTVELTKLS